MFRNKTDNRLNCLAGIANGRRMYEEFSSILEKVPVGKWVRCKDIKGVHYNKVAKLFNALTDANLMEKRTVDDGTIVVTRYYIDNFDDNNNPSRIPFFDDTNHFIGLGHNPKFNKHNTTHNFNKIKDFFYDETISISHSEFKLLS